MLRVSELTLFYILCVAYCVSIFTRLIKCWETSTAKWTEWEVTDPEGFEFLFAFGLSPWSWYTHIPQLGCDCWGRLIMVYCLLTVYFKFLASPCDLWHVFSKKQPESEHRMVPLRWTLCLWRLHKLCPQAQATSIFPLHKWMEFSII